MTWVSVDTILKELAETEDRELPPGYRWAGDPADYDWDRHWARKQGKTVDASALAAAIFGRKGK